MNALSLVCLNFGVVRFMVLEKSVQSISALFQTLAFLRMANSEVFDF